MSYLQNLSWPQIAAVVGVVVVVAVSYGKPLLDIVLKAGKKVAPKADNDMADLEALKRLDARGERSECKVFQDAVDVCFKTFFHTGDCDE